MSFVIRRRRVQFRWPTRSSMLPLTVTPTVDIVEELNRAIKAKNITQDAAEAHEQVREVLGRLGDYISSQLCPHGLSRNETPESKSITLSVGKRGSINFEVLRGLDRAGTYQVTSRYCHGLKTGTPPTQVAWLDNLDAFFNWDTNIGDAEWDGAGIEAQLGILTNTITSPHIMSRLTDTDYLIRADGIALGDTNLGQERDGVKYVIDIVLSTIYAVYIHRWMAKKAKLEANDAELALEYVNGQVIIYPVM